LTVAESVADGPMPMRRSVPADRLFGRQVGRPLEPAERVGQKLDATRRRQPIVEDQMPVARDLALLAARRRDPPIDFGARRNLAPHLQPPDGPIPGRDVEPHLGKRNAELRVPPRCGDACRDFPHAVVVAVGGRVVEVALIGLHARGVHSEHVRVQVIVPRVETEGDDIALREIVTPAKTGADGRGVARVATRGDVQIPIVVRDLDNGAFGRPHHVVGFFLHEVFDRFCVVPDPIVQPSVDLRWDAADPERDQFLSSLLGDGRLCGGGGTLRQRGTRVTRAHHEAHTQRPQCHPSWHDLPVIRQTARHEITKPTKTRRLQASGFRRPRARSPEPDFI
jgi:hypothetical protein